MLFPGSGLCSLCDVQTTRMQGRTLGSPLCLFVLLKHRFGSRPLARPGRLRVISTSPSHPRPSFAAPRFCLHMHQVPADTDQMDKIGRRQLCFHHPAASPTEGARASDSTRRQFCQKGHHLNTQPEPDLPRLALTPNDHPIPHGIDVHYLIKPGGFHYHPVTTTGPSFQPRPELEELVVGNSSLSADVAARGNWAVDIGFPIFSYLRGTLFSFGFFYHFTLHMLLPRVDI